MTSCVLELPEEVLTQMRQVADAEQKTLSQLITEWLRQRLTMRSPVPPADPDILKFFGSLPDFLDRAPQGEDKGSQAWIELKTAPRHTIHTAAQSTPPYHDLDGLAGTWTESDSREFFANIAELTRIDEELWR